MKVLVYDGDCHMCNTFIQYVLKYNKNHKIRITSLNSNWSEIHLTREDIEKDSIIFIDNKKKYYYSNAILHLMVEMNNKWKIVYTLKIIPLPLRTLLYKYIAKNRYRLFKNTSCKIPTKKEREVFLD